MKISVVIPVYNTEKYLEKCIHSVLNQTLQDIEVLIINDGSPDKSLDIMKFYAALDNRITVFDTPNRGVHEARNLGLSHAKGDYILFLDSDDYIASSMLWEMYEQISKTGVDVAVANYQMVYDDYVSEPILTLPNSSVIDIQKNHCEYLCRILKEELYLSACVFNKMFRTSFLKETHLLFESRDKIFAEDAFFYYKLLSKIKEIAIIDKPLYFYYQRNTSVSNSYKKGFEKQMQAFISGLKEYYKNHSEYRKIKESIDVLSFKYFLQVLQNERDHGIDYNGYKKILQNDFFKEQLNRVNIQDFSLKRKLFYLFYRCKMYRFIYNFSKQKGDENFD